MPRSFWLLLALALGATTLFAVHATPSDHLDSPYIDRLPMRDIGDLFVWNGAETDSPVFLINLNPLTEAGDDERLRLDDSTLYTFKLDLDGDTRADVSYTLAVEGMDAAQTVTLFKATGADAEALDTLGTRVVQGLSTPAGADDLTILRGINDERLFVGPRQDPFFFDFRHVDSPVALDLRFALGGDGLPSDGSAANTFGPTNITAVVLEVPELKGQAFSAWAVTSVDGIPQDRCGRSSITAIFLPNAGTGRNPDYYPYGDLKQTFNETHPSEDVTRYGEAFRYRLEQVEVDESEQSLLADFFLPDVLTYDPAEPQAYPNGRNLSEDAVYWTINRLNPFMWMPDSMKTVLPGTNPQPLTSTFPYAAPPVEASAEPETTSCSWSNLFCLFGLLA